MTDDTVIVSQRQAVSPQLLEQARFDVPPMVEAKVRHDLLKAGVIPDTINIMWICEGRGFKESAS